MPKYPQKMSMLCAELFKEQNKLAFQLLLLFLVDLQYA